MGLHRAVTVFVTWFVLPLIPYGFAQLTDWATRNRKPRGST